MPSQLCVGDGNLLDNSDSDLNIKDMYFPFVGMENHVSGHFCKFGIWADKRLSYKEDSLITDVSVGKPDLSLELRVEDELTTFAISSLRKSH